MHRRIPLARELRTAGLIPGLADEGVRRRALRSRIAEADVIARGKSCGGAFIVGLWSTTNSVEITLAVKRSHVAKIRPRTWLTITKQTSPQTSP